MKEKIIEIKNLSKNFGDIKAVQNLSFSVEKGELFAFLGLNRAGKSTTISIMCGQLSKDVDTVVISGADLDHEIDRIHSELGVVFQNSVLDKQLTVKNNLITRAALYGITGEKLNVRISELTEMFDLGSFMKRPVGKLSGGQKRRVDVARALLHEPTILILDKPTTGLEPKTRRHLWDVLDDIKKKRMMTVFLTTHYMDETTDVDHVRILDNGKITAEGTPIELKNRYTGGFHNALRRR